MIEILYKDNYKSLLSYAIRHTGDVQLAMDIVHAQCCSIGDIATTLGIKESGCRKK